MIRGEKHRARSPMARGAAALVGCMASAALAQEPPVVPALLQLSDAIRIALEGSTEVGTDRVRLEATQKEHRNAWFNLGPDLQISAGRASDTRKDFGIQDSLGNFSDEIEESTRRAFDASASMRVFDGFANYNRISAAGHDVQAGEYALAYTRKRVQEGVISAYYNLLRAKLLLGVAEEAEKVAREQLERTQALYELGSAARSDVLKSQVQHGNTRLDLVRARNNQRQTKVDLEYAMNLTASAQFDIDTTVADPTSAPMPAYEAERDSALSGRENLLSMRHLETAASRRVRMAQGTLLPAVDIRYSLGQTKTTSAFRFGAERNVVRQWGLQVSWTLWDRYANYAAISNARATARQAEFSRRQAELDAIREVRQLVNAIDEARERLGVARENVARSREDLRLAQEKFRVGAGTILDTITAESDLTLTRANEVQAVVDYLIARANLTRATGRDFSEL